MTDTVLTVGIPTLAVLVGILVNNSRLSDLRAHMPEQISELRTHMSELRAHVDARFAALERVMDARFGAAHNELLRVEGVLDARLSHLERERD